MELGGKARRNACRHRCAGRDEPTDIVDAVERYFGTLAADLDTVAAVDASLAYYLRLTVNYADCLCGTFADTGVTYPASFLHCGDVGSFHMRVRLSIVAVVSRRSVMMPDESFVPSLYGGTLSVPPFSV